jgi:NCS1 family nucleobase:cation symporter-1
MGFTTQQMIAFLIFWTIYTLFIFLRPYQLRHFFTAKAFIGFVACTGLFIYSMAATKGNLGPLFSAKQSGSNLGWLVIWCVNSAMGNTATLIMNQPDLARWGRTNNFPMVGVLVSKCGPWLSVSKY